MKMISFSVENFGNISDKQTISFVSDNKRDKKYNEKINKSLYLNNIISIFGENGSGKTTMLKALEYFVDRFIQNTFEYVNEQLFRRMNEFQPSFFELTFIHEKETYEYRVRISYNGDNDETVIENEKLTKNGTIILFERNLKDVTGSLKDLKSYIKSCRNDVSFLCLLRFLNNEFMLNLSRDVNFLFFKKKEAEEKLKEFIKVEKQKKILLTSFDNIFSNTGINDIVEVNNIVFFIFEKNDVDAMERYCSEGLLNYLYLIPYFYEAKTQNKILVIDDFGMNLNPSLCQNIIEHKSENMKDFQLILSSHQTIIMGVQPLSGMYISNRKPKGNCVFEKISDITDTKPKTVYDIQEMYIKGYLGGIPNIYFSPMDLSVD